MAKRKTTKVQPKVEIRKLTKWDDVEWMELAQKTWEIRIQDPSLTLVSSINRAQEEIFGKDRRRAINTVLQARPLIDRLKEIGRKSIERDKSYDEMRATIKSLQENVTQDPTTEEIVEKYWPTLLDNLTIDDVLQQFDVREIMAEVSPSELSGIAVQRVMEALGNNGEALSDLVLEFLIRSKTPNTPQASVPKPRVSAPLQPKLRLPRVAVFGAKSDQQQMLANKLSGIVEIVGISKKKSTDFPKNCDYYVLWTRFISHSLQDKVMQAVPREKVRRHHGGLEAMVQLIQQTIAVD